MPRFSLATAFQFSFTSPEPVLQHICWFLFWSFPPPTTQSHTKDRHRREWHKECLSILPLLSCLTSHLGTPTERQLLVHEKKGVQFQLVKPDGVTANQIKSYLGGMKNGTKGLSPYVKCYHMPQCDETLLPWCEKSSSHFGVLVPGKHTTRALQKQWQSWL